MEVDKELLAILVCPQCHGKIYLNETQDGIVCDQCRLIYPIVAGIPVMLVDEAQKYHF